jgi:hypothetical protein
MGSAQDGLAGLIGLLLAAGGVVLPLDRLRHSMHPHSIETSPTVQEARHGHRNRAVPSRDAAQAAGRRNKVNVEREPRTYRLRATHVYRREDGQWRIVDRHADFPPADDYEGAFPAPKTTPRADATR